jgi:multidrug efflux pump subunit AcrA (membrane-fusion protein)
VSTIEQDRPRMSIGIFIIAAIILLVGGGFLTYRLSSSTQSTAIALSSGTEIGSSGIPVTGQTYQVQTLENRAEVEISGNLSPGVAENIFTAVTGTVSSVLVTKGQQVSQGQSIGYLDQSQLRYQIATKEYEIEQERLTGSPRKLELLTMEYNLLLKNLEDYTLTTPIAGRISEIHLETGKTVSTGATAARVIDTSFLTATVEIDELDVIRIQPGQEVEVYLDAINDLAMYGIVTSIGLEGTATGNGYAVVPVEIRFDQPDSRILSGFSFSGSVYVSDEELAVVVDRQALRTVTDSVGMVFVVDQRTNTATPLQVQYESFGQLQYKITSGLEGTETLMAPPAMEGSSRGTGNVIGIPGVPGTGGGTGGPPGGGPGGGAPPTGSPGGRP